MLPRNVLAIRRTLGSATEIITSLTSKSSNATLLDYPTGAYTGMRTFDKIGIMDFTGHTTRLATSLQQIMFSTPALDARPDSSADTPQQEMKEDAAATAALAAFRDTDTMKKETTDLVRAGLKFYYKQLKEGLRNGELAAAVTAVGETKVTVLCTWDAKVKEPTLIAHFEPLRAPKSSKCKVEVHGSPRHHATAKNSQWVRDRKELEDALDKDSNEALLVDEETLDVYEGLSSNFFAFDGRQQALLTAPMGSVLQGTIQKVVMNVCKTENISVRYEFPNLKSINDWEGAFISSTSRLVLPIEKLVLPDGSIKEFGECSTIELIRRQVLKECRKRVENLISEEDI